MNNELWLSHAQDTQPHVQLQERIWDELRWESPTDTAAVSVWVEDFVATLSGLVPSYHARIAIQQGAERVSGLRAVSNQLRVGLPPADCRPDGALAAAVANALEWDTRVPHVKLSARVVDGWVTLAGSVERQCERGAAEDAVSHLTGVRGICNEIVIEPAPRPSDFQRLAKAALQRVELRGSHISLETHDLSVTVRGRVHSLADRQAVERAVWSLPGVASVEDLLTVH
ncbi:MAG TPA: BON domain-containing protein [Gemmatimonadales bacterium]|nr:BON domain-containing protein [Gemmatimonadales bacterium]